MLFGSVLKSLQMLIQLKLDFTLLIIFYDNRKNRTVAYKSNLACLNGEIIDLYIIRLTYSAVNTLTLLLELPKQLQSTVHG